MGGFTEIRLRDTSENNIIIQNRRLEKLGVAKRYRFYSEANAHSEYYEYYLVGKGNFPEHLFPKNKISSYEDFRRYWSPEALGSCFVPHVGTLTFDCYFGRTSKRAMRAIGKYVARYSSEIKSVDGSFSTFMERGMTKVEREIIANSDIKGKD
jgi:hypothetical protein